MKKILLMGSLLALSLFAKEEVVTPEIEMNLSLNDDAKILVDCSYKEVKKLGFIGGVFASKLYSDDENINNLKSIVCKDTFPEQREISLKDLYNAAKTVVKDTDYDISLFTEVEVKRNSFNNEVYYSIGFSKERFIGNHYNIITPFLVTSFENSKLVVKQVYNLSGSYNERTKEQNYLIKSYNFDYKNKKVTSFEIDKPLNFSIPITFTDTYDIDSSTECINGKVWIKKYGNTAGEHCKWIEKVSNNPFESLNVQVTGVSGKGNFIEIFFNYQDMRCNIKMDFMDNKYYANEFFCVETDGVEYYSEFPSLINSKHTYTLVNKKDKQPISKIFPIEKSMLDIIKSSN